MLCLFTISFFSATAQPGGSISGQVSDAAGRPVIAATVILVNAADSLPLKTTSTGNNGRFVIQSLQAGSYKIWITHVDYQKYQSNLITINPAGRPFDQGQIIIQKRTATQLKEVVISGKKPFVEHKMDRTVINVDALATNEGISALDVLEKSPGILVDPNGSISLEGKQGAVVYIDDKKSYLTGADLAAYLASLPSGSLDQIELMTNPPAKYDAAANGGVINIRLKKNKIRGFNGGLTLLYGQWRYGKTEERFNFNYRSGKFNLYGNIGDNQQNYSSTNRQTRQYLDPAGYYGLYNYSHTHGHTLAPQVGLDYYQSDKTTIGVLFNGTFRPSTILGQSVTNLTGAGMQPDSTVNQYFNNSHNSNSGYANLNYRHQYYTKGHELTADFDYNFFRITDNQLFNNITTLPNGQYTSQSQQAGLIPDNINIYAFKSDYAQPFKNGIKLETGLKTSFTHTDNQANYFNIMNNISRPDYTKTNHFLYDENINAAYLSATKDWKRLSVEAGLRMENTVSKGNQLGNPTQRDSSFKRNYTGLFPIIFLQYKLDSTSVNQFGLNYGRRINRPYYQDMNPFVIPEDQFNYDAGNPYLKPSYAQNLQLSYIYKNNLTVKFSYTRTTGDIQTFNKIENGIIYSTFDNIGTNIDKTLSINGSINPSGWFSLNAYAALISLHTQTILNSQLTDIYGTYLFLNGNMQFKLGSGWNTELNGFFKSRSHTFQMTDNAQKRLNAVFQKKISANFTARLVFTDFLYLFKQSGTINNLVLTHATYLSTYDTRGFNISLTYRFGKIIKDLRNHQDSASGSEQGRVKN